MRRARAGFTLLEMLVA
ncbi:prepilin-type N-terminal cleavage/methylation domain-containing protein, partial [Streptococcus danieliae]|nr:prepilin-type N-terminal cleavage/methylation domain-containing protein [Streptococcus danieliae]